MSNIFNESIKLNIFGESHSPLMGIGLDGIAPGIKISFENIKKDLARRSPNPALSNARIEKDEFECIAGLNKDGFTTGEQLVFLVKNGNYDDSEYSNVLRMSHADYTTYVKSNGYANLVGGGARSGRLTVLLVIAGSICKDILRTKNITINSSVLSPSDDEVIKAKEQGLSLGGKIRCIASGVECGLGEPYFDSFESIYSHLVYSVPGVKAIEFGDGVNFATMNGNESSEEFKVCDKKITYTSNHNGGILGGVTNGNTIESTVTFKPTASVSNSKCLDLDTFEVAENELNGRHDTCFAIRCGVILEACMAITILSFYSKRYGYMWMK